MYQYWLQHSLFTWQWWVMMGLIVLCSGIFWLLVNKQHLLQIVFYGSLISIICIILDVAGTNLGWWTYPQQLVWFYLPPIIPLDLCILPIEHMLVYQYFPKWRGFVLTLVVVGLVNAFIAEPLYVWAGLYKLYSWWYVYSVPIYIIKGVVAKLAVQQMMKYERRMRMAGDKS